VRFRRIRSCRIHADPKPITSTPGEMLNFINAEYGRYTQAIKLAGLTVQ
jgi:hypothetical protein